MPATPPRCVNNTSTFSFVDVSAVVYDSYSIFTGLRESFDYAKYNYGIFDPLYSGNTDRLTNFRNYCRCVDSTAAISISGNSYVCQSGYTILTVSGGTLGTNANWFWYYGSCGGTFVDYGTSVVAYSGGTYYVRAEGTCGNTTCVSKYLSGYTVYTVGVTISTGTTWVCNGASLTLTATTVNGGSGPTYQWQFYDREIPTWEFQLGEICLVKLVELILLHRIITMIVDGV